MRLANLRSLHYARAIVREDAAREDERGVRRLAWAAALAIVAFAVVLRHYGLDLIDEGTLLAQTDRVRRGEWPYRDFHTGYGPASFVLNAALMSLWGVRLEVVRFGLAATHGVALATLAWLAGRALGIRAAVAVLALTLAFFFPIAPGAFCVWNIPYPGWYAQAVGGLGLLAALATARRGGAALFASGLCWGVAFCFKQNAGVLGLAGVLVWRAVEHGRAPGEAGGRATGVLLATAMAAGVAAMMAGGALGAAGTLALAAPVLVLAGRVAMSRPRAALFADAVWLGAGFALVVVPVLVAMGSVVGWPALARQVLHLGSGAAAVYGAAFPTFGDLGAAFAAEPGWRSLRQAADLAWLFVLPLGHLTAAAGLGAAAGNRVWRLVVPQAVLGYLQLYPRADFWHLLPVAGLSAVVLVGVAMSAAARLAARAPRALAAALVVVAAVRWLPNVAVLQAALGAPPADLPRLARATVRWDLATAPALRGVPAVVRALDGAPQAIGFPALAVFNFLSGVASPLHHDYFFPGLLTEGEQVALGATLAAWPRARVVVLREPVAFVPEALASHSVLDAAIARAFPAVRRIGPYELREAAP